MGFHADQSSGRLQSKVLRDVEAVQGLCQHLVDSGLSGVVGLIVAFSVTLPKDPRTALLYVLLVPIAVVIQRLLRNYVVRRNQDFRKSVEEMLARVGEMIAMIPVTRAHGLEEHEVEQVSVRLTSVERAGVRFDVINAVFGASWWTGMHLVEIVFLALVSHRAFTTGTPTVEDVILYWGFFQVVLGSVSLIVNMYPTVARGMEAIRSIGEVLECPDVEQNAGKRKVNAVRGAYRFERVTFGYGSDQAAAVRDLSLDVTAGECVAFVGPSGAGKSTVMNLIIGFRRPTAGRILLDGTDMNELDLRTYRRFIAVIPQETLLFSASVRDNITYGLPVVPESRLRQILDAANVTEFLPQLPDGLDTVVGERGAKLSGGQRQRVAIARALIRDPRVILLDEATSALDVVSERYVQEAIDRLVRDRTTFIVAHRLSTIRRAGRIVVLKDGQCVEAGTADELLRRQGEFHRMKLLQE
jgi:ATP-binding cassette subfamily B protein